MHASRAGNLRRRAYTGRDHERARHRAGGAVTLPDVLRGLQTPGAWQWLVLPALGAGALIVGRLLGSLTARAVRLIARRTPSTWDDALSERLPGPLSLLWAAGIAYAAKTWLSLAPRASAIAGRVLGITAVLAVFWLLLRG